MRRTPRLENLESRELLTSGGPTDQQQYMLYLLNMARTNPAQMAQRVTSNLDANVTATVNHYNINLQSVKNTIANSTPQPPLAWNGQLANAAQGHSQDMANTGVQSHTGSDGSSPSQRMTAAGYGNQSSSGENAYAYATSVDEAMEAFLIDWGVSDNGHRDNILQPGTSANNAYRDVGIGIVNTNGTNIGPVVVTQDFASHPNEQAQLLGVVFNDPSHTNFFAPGEGQGGVTIQAVNQANGQTTSVQTWDSGGYQIPLSPGTYNVTAIDNNQVVKTQQVTIGKVNVEVDYDLSNPWQGGPVPSNTPPPSNNTGSTNNVVKASFTPAVAPTNTTSNNNNNSNSNNNNSSNTNHGSSNNNSSNSTPSSNPPSNNGGSNNSNNSSNNSNTKSTPSTNSTSSSNNTGSQGSPSGSSGWSIWSAFKS
jgi:uncharacterized protein YkwD